MQIQRIFLYRMTHIDNIPHVLDFGITHKNSINANPTFRTIGDTSLIDTRNTKEVIVDNGELFSENAKSIVLGDFIPFYFGVRMPMLYVIQVGGNFVKEITPPHNIVYVVCSLQSIIDSNTEFYYSDGHATDNLTTFFSSDKATQLGDVVSWESVKTKYWGGQDNLNTKRKKQAEFLVRGDIQINCVKRYGVYDDAAKEKMINFGVDADVVKIIPRAYY